MDRRRFLTFAGVLALPLPELTRLAELHRPELWEAPLAPSLLLELELWGMGRHRHTMMLAYTVASSPQSLSFRTHKGAVTLTGRRMVVDMLRIPVPGHDSLVWSQSVGPWWLEPKDSLEIRFGDPLLLIEYAANRDPWLVPPGDERQIPPDLLADILDTDDDVEASATERVRPHGDRDPLA